jgi:hypothetical protein
MSDKATTAGACLCGTVSYEFAGPFIAMSNCHCSMCRKHHGAAFATFAIAPIDGFRWLSGEAAIGRYRSSEQGQRLFCTTCGSVAPTLMPELKCAIAPAGNLKSDPGVRPKDHMFAASKAPWYTITDDGVQHAGYPPEYGGGLGIERPVAGTRAGVISGSCLCGEVAYEVDAPLRMINCHCSRCRRGRSAAHATNLIAKIDAFRWLRGSELVAEYKVPDARFFAVAFCTRCGSDTPRISKERGVAIIPAGTLDTDPGIRPQAHIFVGSKAPWFDITDTLPQFAEAPPS